MILCGSHVGFQLIPVGPDGSIHGCKPFCVPIFFFIYNIRRQNLLTTWTNGSG